MVSDLDKSMDFYLRALGMRLSDFVSIAPGMSIQFLRCTPRHHTVALGGLELGDVEGRGWRCVPCRRHARARRAGVVGLDDLAHGLGVHVEGRRIDVDERPGGAVRIRAVISTRPDGGSGTAAAELIAPRSTKTVRCSRARVPKIGQPEISDLATKDSGVIPDSRMMSSQLAWLATSSTGPV